MPEGRRSTCGVRRHWNGSGRCLDREGDCLPKAGGEVKLGPGTYWQPRSSIDKPGIAVVGRDATLLAGVLRTLRFSFRDGAAFAPHDHNHRSGCPGRPQRAQRHCGHRPGEIRSCASTSPNPKAPASSLWEPKTSLSRLDRLQTKADRIDMTALPRRKRRVLSNSVSEFAGRRIAVRSAQEDRQSSAGRDRGQHRRAHRWGRGTSHVVGSKTWSSAKHNTVHCHGCRIIVAREASYDTYGAATSSLGK